MSKDTSNSGGGMGCLGLIILGALFGWAFLDMSPKAAVILGFKVAAGWVGFILGIVAIVLLVALGSQIARNARRRRHMKDIAKWDQIQ